MLDLRWMCSSRRLRLRPGEALAPDPVFLRPLLWMLVSTETHNMVLYTMLRNTDLSRTWKQYNCEWWTWDFFCRIVGSQWALEQAKYNLVNEYLLVGVTEELEDFVMMLEAALPQFFRGATELYKTGDTSAGLLDLNIPSVFNLTRHKCRSDDEDPKRSQYASVPSLWWRYRLVALAARQSE